MPKTHAFTIYNASAGSGKTFTLVKEYLKILFNSSNLYLFKNILAITFTNKAVAEMKDRIIDMLKEFSEPAIVKNPSSMFKVICEDLDMEPQVLHKKAEKLLNTIVHNYAAFDISTIDGFTHKLIRTFAHDLKLPLNFEVELDQDSLLNEAVDSLINKAGTNEELTKVLVDFAIEKADDDKSWDIAFDFNKIAKLLVNENDIPFIEKLKDKTLTDFKVLKAELKKSISETETDIVAVAKSVLNLIEEAGLEFNDFSRGTLPNHFKKASNLELDKLYENKLEQYITEKKGVYTQKLNPDLAHIIDNILPNIEVKYKAIKTNVFNYKFLKNFYKNITPLSVLKAINTELNHLKLDQNKMLISEFNSIISKEIKAQPTPFIYERIGEKFKHYFIDEFQDTSVMQWENLIPLLDNSLSAIEGSTMLVGDAKQAIYRWRGGKAEQFIDLFTLKKQPFSIKQYIKNLPNNYRSFKEIVTFNNGFFKFISSLVFSKKDYEILYENAHQNSSINENGYVELSFLDLEKDDDRDAVFSEKVLKTIHLSLENGYQLQDICVLVRKKKEGVAIANYLNHNEIPIISSETLLLSNSPEVIFVNHLLALLIQPKNDEIKISVLNYLVALFKIDHKHEFFVKHINLSISELFKSFETYNIFVNSNALIQIPLYDLAETIIRSFNLVTKSNAYIQFYLDFVLDFTQKKGSDISSFLSHFEKKKGSLSIVSPKGQNAVQIMTIHKSKGLEFPVVIFPYADLDIYEDIEPKEWFKLNAEKYNNFSHTLLNFNKDFEYFGDEGANIFNKHQSELELDSINLLYVTLTRAVEQLYIISKKDITAKGVVNSKKYSGLFINYLKYLGLWDDSQLTYQFGNFNGPHKGSNNTQKTIRQTEFISTSKEARNIKVVTKSGFLWDTNQKEAIEKGNLIHNIMSEIYTATDLDNVIENFIKNSTITQEQATALKSIVFQIISHPKLECYYNCNDIVYNEHDIISANGVFLRPDRVNINSKKEAVIIDYKTGLEDQKHIQQLQLYQDVLEDMTIHVEKKLLVYVNDDILVKDA